VGLNVKIDGEEDFFDSCLAVTRAVKIEMVWNKSIWAAIFERDVDPLLCNGEGRVTFPQKIRTSSTMGWVGTVFLKKKRTKDYLPNFWGPGLPKLTCVKIFFFCNGRLGNLFSFVVNPTKTFCVISDNTLQYDIPLHCVFVNNQFHITPNYNHII
jgi:hypothetical protein